VQAQEYYKTISNATQVVFEQSVTHCDFLGEIYDYSASLQDWLIVLPLSQENHMIEHSIEQIEFSCLFLMSGMYRQSFSSLRLALELICGAIYFSAHKLEYIEWRRGAGDLNWRTVSDEKNGVFSKRFGDAFFPDLSISHTNTQHTIAAFIYRELSEFVHGNYSTWSREHPSLSINQVLIEKYKCIFLKIARISHFLLSMRYLKEIQKENLYKIETHVMHELQYISEIRLIFGGTVE
jgi:hypothetical protein